MTKVISGLAVLAMVAFASPALADVNSSYIKIQTTNSGSIDNYTSAKAETGSNWAGGSKGGRGGSGGDVEVNGSGDYNNGGATAGEGGEGGAADIGGTVTTGDANADAGSVNTLNTTDVDVDLYGEDMNSSELKIITDNSDCGCANNIDNRTKARAHTGDNDAEGSKGGEGGSGGEVEANSGDNNNGGATAGDGGKGGKSSDGGWVDTGVATSNAGSVNVLNATLVRVRL